jgi:hypothetical protein
VLAAYFQVARDAQPGAELAVMLTDGLGDPPVDNRVVVAIFSPEGHIQDVASIAPTLENGVVRVVSADAKFRRGYINADDRRNIADAVSVLAFLFNGGTAPACLSAVDANDDGKINIADAVRLLGYLFVSGGPMLPPPSTDCGLDPTPDNLTCAQATYGCGS